MRLDALTLYDFRNYAHLEAQFVPGVNLILGENAQGKTNLLEAVAYLSTGRSFRTARPQELVRFGADFADLSAELFSAGRQQTARAVIFAGRRPRQIYVGGVKQKTAAALDGLLTTVLFCPEELQVLKGGAAARREVCRNEAVVQRAECGLIGVRRLGQQGLQFCCHSLNTSIMLQI